MFATSYRYKDFYFILPVFIRKRLIHKWFFLRLEVKQNVYFIKVI